MRIRIIPVLAAAAAPAALAGVLLGTAGQASAAVTQGGAAAVLTASVQQTYTGQVSQTGVPDTTSVGGGATINNDNKYGPIGPVWAFDNITRNVQVSPAGPGQWTVSFVENGTYNAFADPNTGLAWNNTGNMHGTISYTVQSDRTAPNMAALAQADGPAFDGTTVHGHGYIINLLFSGATVVGYGPYSYHYTQIPDVQGVWKQVG